MRYCFFLLLFCVSTYSHAQAPLQLELKKSHVRFMLGSSQAPKLVSGLSTVPLGGISLADESSSWRYGAAIGRVDKNKNITDLHYGSDVARAWLSTQLSPSLALEGLYQQVEGYEHVGIGGRYGFNSSLELSVNLTPSKHGMDMHWDLGRWGILGANYVGTQPELGQKQHSFGFNQQFWYSPNLRIEVEAQRQTHSDDYNMGLRFSLPVF